MKSEERIRTLTKLGLTFDQSRVYLTLLELGPATAKEIAEISKIARPDIYRIIPTLQKEGLVGKLMANPAIFQATPMIQVLPALLEHKTIEQNKLKNETKELLNEFKYTRTKNLKETNAEFAIIPGKKATIQRLKEAILKTQISVCVVTSQKRFSAKIPEFEKLYREVLGKGIKIKIATDRHVPKEKVLKIVQLLTKDPNFEVKYFEKIPPAIVTIFDNKEAMVTLSATAQLAGTASIWSNNPSFIALAQIYFEKQWNEAS